MKKLKKLIAVISAATLAFSALLIPMSVSATFYERSGVPAVKNSYYYSTDYNPFYTSNLWSYCTWYAYGRAYEILGTKPKLSLSSASQWFEYNKDTNSYPYSTNYYSAKLGAVMCFKNHVAIVESVNSDGSPRLVSSSGCNNYSTAQYKVENWPAARSFYFGAPWDTENFVGYIYITDNGIVNPIVTSSITGVVTASEGLNVRSEIGTDKPILGSVPHNATVAIYPEKSTNGWYYIKYGNLTGYVTGKYINVIN